jgi:hypothetical protein
LNTNNNTVTEQPAVAPKTKVGKLWVAIVLLLGLIWGILISDLAVLPLESRPDFFRPVPVFNPDPSIRLHIIFTSVEVALLVALVVVYLRTYASTRANFALGLVVVLGALLLQAVLSYPLILGTNGFILYPGILGLLADVFTIAAYTVFLYLSLE